MHILFIILLVIILLSIVSAILLFYFNENFNNLVSDEILKGNFLDFKEKLNYSSFNQPISKQI